LLFDSTSGDYIEGLTSDFRMKSSEIQVELVFQGEHKLSRKSKTNSVVFLTTNAKVNIANPEECKDQPSILGRNVISRFNFILNRDSLIFTTTKNASRNFRAFVPTGN